MLKALREGTVVGLIMGCGVFVLSQLMNGSPLIYLAAQLVVACLTGLAAVAAIQLMKRLDPRPKPVLLPFRR